jgi:protein-disulfide isomerase
MEEQQQQPLTKKEQREQNREEKELSKQQAAKKVMMKKLGFAVLLVGIVVGIVLIAIAGQKSPEEVSDQSPDPAKGPENAAVVIKEYSDFQCPACQAAAPVVKDIMEEYGDKVRFIYNDYPLPQHEYATDAAVGAQCAFDQNTFFEYHDLLFENQTTWAPSDSKEKAQEFFRSYAQELNLNMEQFEQCVTDKAVADRVNEDIAEGRALRVNATPTFFVNGVKVTETPLAVGLKNAIEKALNASGQTPQ